MDKNCDNCACYEVCIYANPNRTKECRLWKPEVVRCKDCKYCERDHTLDGGGDEYYYCWHHVMEHGQARKNEFCCYGERKDNV